MALENTEENTAPLRMAKGQRSFNGLNVIAGTIEEECNADLRWPQCMETYKLMCKDATIAPALNLMEMEIAKSEWTVKIPEGYDTELAQKAAFLTSIMDDMEHTWNDFIRQAATINRFGFAPIEKVYYKRIKANGSKHSDGYYGIKALPLISQDTIANWVFGNEGRKLVGLKQWINIPSNEGDIQTYTQDKITINRNKFLLFRADPQKDSPIGTSPLNSIYIAWRFKTELEKYESISVAQDLRGLKVIKIPARYLSEDASDDEKATYEYFKEILRSIHNGEQSGIVIPQAFDNEGNALFDFKLESVMGTPTNNVNEIIGRYRKEVVTGILAPQLIIGQDGSGSFALADSLEGITNTVITSRLKEIRDQLNHDLIPQLFAINGWDTTVTPYFDFSETKKPDLDVLSKFIQRVAAAGLIKVDADTVNWLAEQAGMPIPFDDTEISTEDVKKQLTAYDSNAGEGMEEGSGNGTAKSGSSRDNSSANTEN